MGGEKANGSDAPDDDEGSPPHGQGKDDVFRGQILLPGITPAWAGKSMTAPGRSSRTGDHPRVGGEKNNHIIDNQYGKGSPPRGRGKVHSQLLVVGIVRITPAWAGKRARCPCWCAGGQDHPRVGGEKGGAWWIIILFLGSPPHGRGKGQDLWHDCRSVGITPAWAGKRPASQPWSPPLRMMVIRPRP